MCTLIEILGEGKREEKSVETVRGWRREQGVERKRWRAMWREGEKWRERETGFQQGV